MRSLREQTTRDHIVEAADRLFYRQGYEHTSFADIAAVVQISRGNFYHHFKTKDDILDAVIARRMERTSAMLDGWQAEGDGPRERILSFIQMLIGNQAKIMAFGCPVGTLCSELAKLDLVAILSAQLDPDQRRRLDRLAPATIQVPSGRQVPVDYAADPPVLAVKLQELFGLADTPSIHGGRVRLMLQLLSPLTDWQSRRSGELGSEELPGEEIPGEDVAVAASSTSN